MKGAIEGALEPHSYCRVLGVGMLVLVSVNISQYNIIINFNTIDVLLANILFVEISI